MPRSTHLLAVTLLALAGAAEARATTVSVEENEFENVVAINAGPGEANDVVARYRNGSSALLIVDRSAPIIAGEGCTGGGGPGSRVLCFGGVIASIDLGDGDDALEVSTGEADVRLGPGDDEFTGSRAPENVWPGSGDDTLILNGGYNNVYLTGEEGGPDGADTIDGSFPPGGGERIGEDTVSYRERTDDLSLTLDGIANDGAPGESDQLVNVEVVEGGMGADVIVGNEKDNQLTGWLGGDTIEGAGGNDFLQASSTFWSDPTDPSPNLLYGNAGNDTLSGNDGNDLLSAGRGNDYLFGAGGTDTIRAAAGNDNVESGESDGVPDDADCGKGRDRAVVGPEDARINCEKVFERARR